jgi:F1F0 ATPase subunit 2
MMNETLTRVLACLAGAGLGAVFFGGLWWTIQRSLTSRQPALWFIGSLLLRTCMVLTGFCFVGRGHWDRLLLCLLGFAIARAVVMRLTRPSAKNPAHRVQELRHAP